MSSTEGRITELLVPFLEGSALSNAQLESLYAYLDLLLKWNARINLTSVRDPQEILSRHFGESFFLAHQLFSDEPMNRSSDEPIIFDLGSGAGFPGLPLAIYAPYAKISLLESQNKKATFLKEVARALTLTNVNVFSSRAETYAAEARKRSWPAAADVVTLRAVEKFAQSLPLAASLLSPGGRLALLIGESQLATAHRALPDFSWRPPLSLPLSRSRILLIGDKAR